MRRAIVEELTTPVYDQDEAYEFIMARLVKRGFPDNCGTGEIIKATLEEDYAYMVEKFIIVEDDETDLDEE
jgi:hypothetical protein